MNTTKWQNQMNFSLLSNFSNECTVLNFNVEKLRGGKTAIMQRESARVCSALWRTRVEIKLTPSRLLLYVVYLCQKS